MLKPNTAGHPSPTLEKWAILGSGVGGFAVRDGVEEPGWTASGLSSGDPNSLRL